MGDRVFAVVKNLKSFTFQQVFLLFCCFVLVFTLMMPAETHAWSLFGDGKPKPKTLAASEIKTAPTQAIADPSDTTDKTLGRKKDSTHAYEVESERTPFTSTFVNKDGTKSLEYSFSQQNYKVGNKWEKIDNTLHGAVKPTKALTLQQLALNTAAGPDTPSEFTGKSGIIDTQMKPLAEGLTIAAAGKTIVMKPVGATNVTPVQIDDHTVAYKDAWPGVDLEYELRGESVKEVIVVKKKINNPVFDFKITGGKVIQHPTHPELLTIEGLPETFSFSTLTVDVSGQGVISEERATQTATTEGIRIAVDKAWLNQLSSFDFPVRIDPTLNNGEVAANYYTMYKSDGYSCGSSNCYANTGSLSNNGWKSWRTYFTFAYGGLIGKTVLDANMHGYYKTGIGGTGQALPRYLGQANCWGFNCLGTYVGEQQGVGGDFNINFTWRLQQLVAAGDTGAVWSLWGNECGCLTYKPYWDLRATVTYDTPTPMTTPVEPAEGQVTVNTQPTLRVNPVSDADGDAVKYYFLVSTGATGNGAVITSGWIPSTQWTVPEGILQDGTTYYWRVYTLGARQTDPNWTRSFKINLRTGKDSTQAYDTVGPIGIDLATGGATTGTGTHSMSALGGSIGLSLDYNNPAKAKSGLIGEYWNTTVNYNFSSGAPTSTPNLTRNDQDINFDWNLDSPSPTTINTDWFYSRWKGYFVAPTTGSYTFGAAADDSVNVYINDQKVYGRSCCGASVDYTGATPVTLQAGQIVPIRVEYQEANSGAYVKLYVKGAVPEQVVPREWLRTEVQATPAQYGLQGRYFTDDGSHNFPGNDADPLRLMMARTDSKLNFNWGTGGPAPGLQSDNFLVRWTGYITVPATGSYTLGAYGDDGVRIKVNNGLLGAENTVLNSWQDQSGVFWGSATNLPGGQAVPITVEYFEHSSSAAFALRIQGNGFSDQEIPVTWLTPKASVLPDAWRLGVDVDGNIAYERLRVAGQDIVLEDSTRSTHTYAWTGSGYKPPVNEDGQLTKNSNNTYTLLDTDGRNYVFDAEGKLTSVTTPTDDRNPAALKYEYSGSPSRLTKITDGVTSSRYGTLHYKDINEDSNCSKPDGFDDAPAGMLCAFKTSDGDVTKLYYKAGQLSRVEKPGNELTDYGYDSLGRITSTRDSLANDTIAASIRADDTSVLTELTYDSIGRISSVKAPAATASASRVNHTFEYLPAYLTQPGATQMHITGAPEPNGFSKRIEYDNLLRTAEETDVAGLSSMTEWDPVKDLQLSKTDATGLKSTTIYDQLDRTTDSYGPAPAAWYGTDRKPLAANVNQVPHTSTGYDEGIQGLAVTMFNNTKLLGAPKLYTTGYTQPSGEIYYEHNLTNTTVTPTDGISMRATGKIRLDQAGNYTFRLFNGGGARLYIDNQLVVDNWVDGQERYSPEGTYSNSTAGKYVSITIEANKLGTSGTGINGRLVAVLHQKLPGQSTFTTVGLQPLITPAYNLTTSQTAYDNQLGNVTTTTQYSNPAYGTIASTTLDPTGLNYQSTATYETPGAAGSFLRQTSKTLPGGGTTTYQHYGANDTADNPCTTDVEAYHQAGRPKGKVEADPDGAGSQTSRTSETIYNESGDVVATRYNSDPWTCINYDARGRQVSTVQPTVNGRSGRTITSDYAVDGNPLKRKVTDSVAGTTEATVDLLGRAINSKDVWGNEYTVTYDDLGNVTQKTGPLGIETYVYDAFSRPTAYTLDGTTLAALTYDGFSRVATVTYPEAKDTAGNTLKLTQLKRDSLGRSSGVIYQTSDGKTFDETTIRSQLGKITSAAQVYDGQTLNSSFAYDKVGRLTSGTVGQTKFDYGYSTPDNATCGSNGANNSLAHKNSNRTSYKITNLATNTVITDDKLCFNYADQLTYSTDASIGTPTYDDHGNTTSFSGSGIPLTFGYDANDYNISIEQGTKRTEYVKAATGGILRKKEYDSGNLTASYRYVAGGAILQSCSLTDDGSCSTLDRYISLPGGISLTLSPTNSNPDRHIVYSLHNYHGDTALTLTTEGKATPGTSSLLAYGPFGEQLLLGTQGTAAAGSPNASDNTMGWAANPARKQDDRYTTTLIQMGARVYIPSLGRFLQVDSVEGGTLNPYVYVSDPINSSDYNGRWGIGDIFNSVVNTVKKVAKAVARTVANKVASVVTTVGAVISNVVTVVRPYIQYLGGSGKSTTVKTKDVPITVNKSDLQNYASASAVSVGVGAQTGGPYSLVAGRLSGTFNGTITKTTNGYHAVGSFTPNTDTYDFNSDGTRGFVGELATGLGRLGGEYETILTAGARQPKAYKIYFDGSMSVDMSW